MPNEIATRSATALTVPKETGLPPRVRLALDRWRDPCLGRTDLPAHHPDNQREQITLHGDDLVAAQRTLRVVTAALERTVDEAVLREWLQTVSMTSRIPLEPEDLDVRLPAFLGVLQDLPAFAFSVDAMRRLTNGFFPSAPDVRAAVQPEVNEATRLRDGLRALVDRSVQA